MKLIDPLQIEPVRLTVAAIEWLASDGSLTVTAVSPLSSLLSGPRQTSAEEQEAASGDIDDPRRLRAALEIIAAPEAMMRISVAAPPGDPFVAPLYLAGGSGVFAQIEEDALYLGAAFPLESLAAALQRQLDSELPPSAPGEVQVWSSHLTLCSMAWPDGEESLLANGIGPADAKTALDGLIDAGLLARENDRLSLRPPYDYWLPVLWSGHMFQIDRIQMMDGAEPVQLVFAGPAEAVRFTREVTDEESGGNAEDPLIVLTHLDPPVVTDAIEGMLGL